MRSLLSKLPNAQHPAWAAFQQLAGRGAIALKFLIAAAWLGPQAMGLVAVAMVSLAIVEALTDTGMSQAVVQRKNDIDVTSAGAIWSLQALRGCAISLILISLSATIAKLFAAPDAGSLVALAGLTPLVRNSINPGLLIAQRERQYRRCAFVELAAVCVDFCASLAGLAFLGSPAAMLLATIAAETVRLAASWTVFYVPLKPFSSWRSIQDLTSFGKWVWGSSVISLILNQSDKLLVARFFGTTELGLYHVASKLAQLAIADVGTALTYYTFPTLSALFRSTDGDSWAYAKRVFVRLAFLLAILALLLSIFAAPILRFTVGETWLAAAPLVRAMTLPMSLGGLNTILVAYVRSIGRPDVVVQATVIQLMVLAALAPILLPQYGPIGMAASLAIAVLSVTVYLYWIASTKQPRHAVAATGIAP